MATEAFGINSCFLKGGAGLCRMGILHSSGLSELLCLFTIYWSQQQKNGWGAGRECHGEEGVHKYYYEKKRSAVNQMHTSQCPLSQRADPGWGNMESDPASLNSVHLFYTDKKTSVYYIKEIKQKASERWRKIYIPLRLDVIFVDLGNFSVLVSTRSLYICYYTMTTSINMTCNLSTPNAFNDLQQLSVKIDMLNFNFTMNL